MRTILTILIVLAASNPAFATPFVPDFSAGPLVFDFEGGLQGWVATGSAQRVNTQVLGGEWAIFGDGLTFIELTIDGISVVRLFETSLTLSAVDLTHVASISIQQFYAGPAGHPSDFLLLSRPEPQGPGGITVAGSGTIPLSAPGSNPDILVADLSQIVGVTSLTIHWRCFSCLPNPTDLAAGLGFIDNIAFSQVPEPSAFLLVSAALCSWRFRRASRIRC